MTHERLEAFIRMKDAHNRVVEAERINDPHRRIEERDAAYREAAEAFAQIFGELALERAAGAFMSHGTDEVKGAGPEAIRAAAAGVDTADLRDPAMARGARNAIARLLSDHAGLLPPGVASHAEMGLHMLSLGEAPPLFQPAKAQGQKLNKSRKYTAKQYIYARIYYRKGHDGGTLEEAIRDEEPAISATLPGKITSDAIRKFADRGGLRGFFKEQEQRGEADRRAGKPLSYPLEGDYNLAELAKLSGR